MYTNIPTHIALNLIRRHLRNYQQTINQSYPTDAVQSGLCLVMTQNIFTFGNTTFKQLNGTAMGMPPAPPYATIYYGIQEAKFVPCHHLCVIFYCQFIDDVISIWNTHPNEEQDSIKWMNFQSTMNTLPGLTLEFSSLLTSVDFMDMTISINTQNNIETMLFEKKLHSLHPPPPHSAHPPGLLLGIVYSTLF